jgi:hypothetical protein
MWKDFWALALQNPDFVSIFTIAILVLGFQTLIKYITKLPVILKDPPDEVAKTAAHFDCLQMGLDLSMLGLVASFAVFQLAIKAVRSDEVALARVTAFQMEFIIFQFILMVLATIFTTVFASPEKTFYRGIGFPSVIGAFSVYSSAVAFKFFKLG